MFYKAVITSKGLALDAKIKAGQTTAAFTRVKLGDGTYDGQEELKEATDLKNTRNEFGISSIKVIDENTVRIRIVTNNSNLNSGYYISELALFATDPDEGEILYSISLGVPEKMDYQPSEAEMFNATATIDILTSISDAETANIQTGTGAAASAEDLAELETRMEGIETPEFDASGTVEGITGKTTLLASFVTRMPLVKFMRNVVAGFKLVLYAGQVVNNCVTDNASLPLSAAQGKVLMDLYTVLNTNLNNRAGLILCGSAPANDANLLFVENRITFFETIVSTLNTPYKANLTQGLTAGIAITYMSAPGFGIQLHLSTGASDNNTGTPKAFMRAYSNYIMGAWH